MIKAWKKKQAEQDSPMFLLPAEILFYILEFLEYELTLGATCQWMFALIQDLRGRPHLPGFEFNPLHYRISFRYRKPAISAVPLGRKVFAHAGQKCVVYKDLEKGHTSSCMVGHKVYPSLVVWKGRLIFSHHGRACIYRHAPEAEVENLVSEPPPNDLIYIPDMRGMLDNNCIIRYLANGRREVVSNPFNPDAPRGVLPSNTETVIRAYEEFDRLLAISDNNNLICYRLSTMELLREIPGRLTQVWMLDENRLMAKRQNTFTLINLHEKKEHPISRPDGFHFSSSIFDPFRWESFRDHGVNPYLNFARRHQTLWLCGLNLQKMAWVPLFPLIRKRPRQGNRVAGLCALECRLTPHGVEAGNYFYFF